MAVYFLTLGREPLNHCLDQLRDMGWIPFYLVFTASISAGVPATPFLLMAGAAFDLPTNLLGLAMSFAVSLAVSFFYANRLFKRQLGNFLSEKAPVLAGVLQASPIAATILVRLTPGFPYVLQNCFLVTICRSFASFFLASLPPLLLMAVLFTMLGKNLIAGNYRLLLVFGFALLSVMFVFRYVTRRRAVKVDLV